MNKVILMGRLVRDPEVRYSRSNEPVAVARYTLAVNRRFQKKGEKDEADFIPCVAFGKNGEFSEKYMKKGGLFSVVGRLQVRKWEDNEGKARWTTEVVVEEHYFCTSKKDAGGSGTGQNEGKKKAEGTPDGFYPIDESVEDDDLPF